ncbi:hypothetical protein BN59_00656 [Legionella massiliensis]|uniref:Uncharacterized protein n=1 Tax=Legionella massiliensis TaxID=1034943 RepID=A0A078KTV4_9GAMM|nr:hypothetical protein [Legionella massiliensis]CDZ76387.1 hypothetical protein BN59_00656 [Legionella massiliensis]CEE12125.1 hypothetical protein BN1094_00656 [Legionella massiliensis]
MKNLSYEDRVKLVKLMHKTYEESHSIEELISLRNEGLLIICENPEQIQNWISKGTANLHEHREFNKLISELNDYQMKLKKAEEKILSAGSKLNSDFSGAELDAKEAIRLASGNPKKYDEDEMAVNSYFASSEAADINNRKKAGEKVEHPKEILAKQQFIKESKNVVNTLANSLMVRSPAFRAARIDFIKKSLEDPQYNAKFVDRNGQMQFRTIRPDGDYGKPEVTFKEGLAPQFVSIWAFQSGVISKPYVNDIYANSGEKVGWSGGITSTSANLKFCAAYDFAASYGMQEGLIYIYACDEAASIARHITFGVGYDGKVDQSMGIDRSNAEAAMEYMLPYLSPERIIGAREVHKDGSLGEFFPNPNVKESAYGDVEYLKLMLCESVDEIKLIEFLERRSVEIIHNSKNASYVNQMVSLFTNLPPNRQAVVLKIAQASLVALNQQLAMSFDQNLEIDDPNKWEMLNNLKFADDLSQPLEILPETIVNMLSPTKKDELKEHLETETSIQVQSHFIYEFEKDKRTDKNIPATQKINYPAPRFFKQEKPVTPVTEDDLAEISKIAPQSSK